MLITGPSTNGRSSAFGALCLGSNPSGPARSGASLVVRRTGSLRDDVRPVFNDRRLRVDDRSYNMATITATVEKKISVDEKQARKPHRTRVDDKFKIFCGTANQPLAD